MTQTMIQASEQPTRPITGQYPPEVILQAKGIAKSYLSGEEERVVLNGVDFVVHEGEFVSVMGPSGAGKSTLLHVLSAMDRADKGTVAYRGMMIECLSEKETASLWARDFGFVFQQSRLVSNLTIRENLVVAALADDEGRREADIAKRAQELIARMGLQTVQDSLPSQVSGGEAQRASVARAVMNKPSVVFADEPTGALNRANGDEVLGLLRQLSSEGQAVVMVTHDHKAALRGDRMVYLRDGEVRGELHLAALAGSPQARERAMLAWLEDRGW